MSASALALPAPSPRDRRPLGWILGLWAAAALLVLVQYFHLQDVQANMRLAARGDIPDLIIPSGRWRFWGIVIPLLLVTAGLVAQFRWTRGTWRGLAGWGLLLMIPVWLVGWVITEVSGPHGFDSVRLADGRHYILAQELVLTDSVYGLYEANGPLDLYWREAGSLDYSEDGRFISNPGLVVSPDEEWLLMTRGGVWTDCFRVAPSGLIDCKAEPYPYWNDARFEQDMGLRSARIAALTGLTPPGNGPDR